MTLFRAAFRDFAYVITEYKPTHGAHADQPGRATSIEQKLSNVKISGQPSYLLTGEKKEPMGIGGSGGFSLLPWLARPQPVQPTCSLACRST